MNTNNDYEDRQSDAWDALYAEIVKLLARWGTEDYRGRADYLVVDDYGWARNTIEIHRWAREIIDGLQRQFLPPEFKDFKIPGSRPGTGYD